MKRTESRGVKIIFVKNSRDVGIVSRSSNCQVGVKVWEQGGVCHDILTTQVNIHQLQDTLVLTENVLPPLYKAKLLNICYTVYM